MKNKTLIVSLLVTALALPNLVLAQNGNQVKNQNEVQTQNQGEAQQLSVQTQEQEMLQASQEGIQKQAGPQAKLQVGQVNASMNGLLQNFADNSDVSQKVKGVAEEQIKAQQQIQNQLTDLESRKGIAKTLFGPKYSAIKSLKQQLEQNRVRIQEMNRIHAQIQNQAEAQQLQQAIQVMEAQNTSLENQLQAEEQTKSLLGWFFKLFA